MPTKEQVKIVVDALSKKAADDGRLIELGWLSFRLVIHPEAGDVQLKEMRTAFFAGAQHLLGSVMTIMEADREPTEKDMARMAMIASELEAFVEELKRRGMEL